MYGYIYMTTNLVNKKKYIGKHKSDYFDTKYIGSGILLRRAIEKYGKDNFKTIMLEQCDSLEELNMKEKEYIELYDCVKSDEFYNLSSGGDGGDTRVWLSEEEKRMALSGENNPMYGKNHSDESKRKMSESKRGRKLQPFTEEHKKKLSESNKNKNKGKTPWNKGLKLSEEDKQRLSQVHKGKKGTRNGMKNSEEHKRKISEARKGKNIKTSLWRRCKICFPDGEEKIYDNLKECAKDNNISYALAKKLIKTGETYKDKHHKNEHIKGCCVVSL